MTRIAIAGIKGRMGQALVLSASKNVETKIVAGLVAPGSAESGGSLESDGLRISLSATLRAECDVLVDVSTPDGTMDWIEHCERHEMPMVIGVTGHTAGQVKRIQEAAHQIPIVFAANFSVGLSAILDVLAPLVQRLGAGFDVEVVETHHRNKVDAPSGTALAIVDEIRRAREKEGGESRIVSGRHGHTGLRKADEIGVHAVRMGDVVGQHEIHFSGPGETVTIRHAAHSREAFAAGALRAAAWVAGKGAGLYSMRDVLAVESQAEPGMKEADPGF